LLEGLEAVEIYKSRISLENDILRFDSQYFKKEYLKEDINRKKYENKYLGQIAFITDGQHGYHEVDESSPIRHLTAKNAKGWFANDIDADRIAKWVDDNNKRSSLEMDDLILSTRGTVGLCAIVDSDVLPSNIDQDVARIKFENSKLLPTVVLTYLNCKVGQDWLERNQTGMVQQGIALWRVREIPLPVFSDTFQNAIDGIIRNSKAIKNKSKDNYKSAETLLLETLGLSNFEPSKEPVNVKGFKESFLTTGRLDAEYYQKKYEEYDKIIRENECGYTSISNEYSLVKSVSSKDKDAYNYIEIGDVNVNDGSATYNLILTSELPANAKTEVKKGDLLISKVRSNRGAVTIIDFDAENLIVSGAFTVLREKKNSVFSNETLKVLLRTTIYKDWLLQFNIGTQYPVIRDEDILNMPIPKISKEIKETVTKQIQSSQNLKKQSEQLLETAKRAVVIAIEQDEEAAIRYIEEA
jgi:type I restriction enzyme, S subunit